MFDNETVARLQSKFRERYRTRVPIELVAYYASQPLFDRPGWLGPIERYVSTNLRSSPFRREWLFDHFAKSIRFVHPPLSMG